MEPNLNPSGMEIMVNGIATEKREHRKKNNDGAAYNRVLEKWRRFEPPNSGYLKRRRNPNRANWTERK